MLSFLNASSSRVRDLYSNSVYYWRFGLLQEYSSVIINKLPLTTNELEVLGYCEGNLKGRRGRGLGFVARQVGDSGFATVHWTNGEVCLLPP